MIKEGSIYPRLVGCCFVAKEEGNEVFRGCRRVGEKKIRVHRIAVACVLVA